MIIGVPKEIKNNENRVGLTPESVFQLVNEGNKVIVETLAGDGIGATDSDYEKSGAKVVKNAATVFDEADLIVKVKEPQEEEFRLIKSHHTIFTYLHLAAEEKLTKALLKSGCTAIAYETITDNNGRLPLLKPMSEVAGRMSIQVGAKYLEKTNGGSGILLGGVPGVQRGQVTIIGGGISGINAAEMAIGLGAEVTVLDRSLDVLEKIEARFGGRVKTLYSNSKNVENSVQNSDLVVGAVLIPGASAPKIVTRNMIRKMKTKSVVVDIAIDQGGCFQTSKPTSHEHPIFEVDGVIHYCVTNMPGAVPRTSSYALNNATLPFISKLASIGCWSKFAELDSHFMNGVNVANGKLKNSVIIETFPHLS